MKRREIAGWTRSEHLGEGLTVYHRPSENYWTAIGAAFYREQLPGLVRVESARTARVYRGSVDAAGCACYFKSYLRRDWSDTVKDAFRASRAMRALMNEQMCGPLGFHLPRSLCLVEKIHGVGLTYCALINEAVEDAPTLRDWLTREDLGLVNDRAGKREMLCAFARELGAWHAAGLHHGDLRLGNVLCRKQEGVYTFYWLDNERNRTFDVLPLRLRVHNLMRINFEPCGVDQTDRLRFWNAYLETAKLRVEDRESALSRTISKTHVRRKKRGWA